METVGVRALKANLSRYLHRAHHGEEIRVVSRGQVVARIVGVRANGSSSAQVALEELADLGLIELPEAPMRRLPKLIRAEGRPLSRIVSEQRR